MSSGKRKGSRSRARLRRRAVWLAAGVAVIAAALAFFFDPFGLAGEDAALRLASGKRRLAAGDIAGAMLDLRAAVQADPNNAAARAALGGLYLRANHAPGALKELQRARALGASGAEVAQGIVRAMVLAGELDKAAAQMAVAGDLEDPNWLVLQGMLDAAGGRAEAAKGAFAKALAKAPDLAEAHLGLVRAELVLGNEDLARTELAAALAQSADDPEIWLLKGQLELHRQAFAEARAAFAKAALLSPRNPIALLGGASAALGMQDLPAALAQLDALGPAAEQDPRALYLQALIAKAEDKPQAALSFLRKVLQVAPHHRESLLLAAAVHFRLGEYAHAEDYARQVLAIEPDNAEVLRMLEAAQLAAGKIESAGYDLSRIDAEQQTDPQLLALLGAAYMKRGQYSASEQSLARAAELAPDSIPIRTQLSLTKLAAGKYDEVLQELLALKRESPLDVFTDTMLVVAHLARGDRDAALAAAKALVAAHRELAVAHNVLAYTFEALGQADQARAEYSEALRIDPAFHAAELNLARVDLAAKNVAAARGRYEAILRQAPDHVQALLGLAAIALEDRQAERALELWQQARAANPEAVAPRLLLANHYRNQRNYALAESMAAEAYRLAPYAPNVQYEYALVLLANDKADEALPVVQALSARFPSSVPLLRLLTVSYSRLDDREGMEKTLQRILEVAPDDRDTRIALGRLALARKDYAGARANGEELLRRPQGLATGHELLGDAAIAQAQPAEAALQYERALSQEPEARLLLKLDAAEREAGIDNDRLRTWLQAYPQDLDVRTAYATQQQHAGNRTEAVRQFEVIIERRAKDPVALNNLAWLYAEVDDARALALAQRAYELAPNHPSIADTYGWILLLQGQHEQARGVLKKALSQAPENPDIRFHFASCLAKLGLEDQALEELQAILEDDAAFASREQAMDLLAELRE